MVQITFRWPGGERVVEAAPGRSVMQVATDHRIPGIEGACGGSLACGTCHTYVDDAHLATLAPADPIETELLEYGVHIQPNSRLCCQVPVTQALDGAVFEVPPSQR